jgi:23S rRNA maturation-related 3'-5' exoribonuclease YhaM
VTIPEIAIASEQNWTQRSEYIGHFVAGGEELSRFEVTVGQMSKFSHILHWDEVMTRT